MQTSAGRWVQILPDEDNGHTLLEKFLWIYDGSTLSLEEQDETAGQILGYQQEISC